MMKLLADTPWERERPTVGSRNWDMTEADKAYLSHHHTVEVVSDLAYEHGLFETIGLHSVSPNEYRNSFISIASRKEFSISTVVYPDSSTYTYLHLGGENLGPVLSVPDMVAHRLPNADIKRAEGRQKRVLEIIAILQHLGILPQPPVEEKKEKAPSGITSRKGEDGIYILDYSGVRSGKIETAERVIDYRNLDKVRPDDQKPPKDGSGV